jgi:4-alpha-glucanotransferase
MNNTAQITQQIAFLNTQHLNELSLFIEFLMTKQLKETQQKAKPKIKEIKLLADIQPLIMPVSHHIIQRDTIYEDRF